MSAAIIQCELCHLPIAYQWKRDTDGRIVHADSAECGAQRPPQSPSAALTLTVSLLCDKDRLPGDREVVAAMTFGLVSLGYSPCEILVTGHELQPVPDGGAK